MPILKARIGGEWVQVSAPSEGGGTDEVWVGPDTPVDPNIEVWVDSDDANMSDPDTARWNSAWGAVGIPVHSGTPHTSNITTYTAIPGMTATWTPVAGRRYKLTATVDWRLQASPAPAFYIRFNILGGVSIYNSLRHVVASNGYYGTTTVVQPAWTFTAGVSTTVEVQVLSSTYPVDFNQYGGSTFVVEDIGPLALAAPPAQPASVWTAYTPTWTADGGGLNFGSSHVTTGRYRVVGDTCDWEAIAQLGGTGISAGSGEYRVTLPLPSAPARAFPLVGYGWAYIGSPASQFMNLVLDASVGPSVVRLIGPAGRLSSTYPAGGFGVAGNAISLGGRYTVS